MMAKRRLTDPGLPADPEERAEMRGKGYRFDPATGEPLHPNAGQPTFRGRPPPEGPFYHGTTTALEIGEELLPPTQTGRQTEPRGQRRGKVFLTTDLEYAESYARRAVREWGGEPLVLEVAPTGPVKQISGRPGASAFHSTGALVKRVIA
jgi:hypothetical protein